MQPTFVDIRYSRVFPHPLDACYEWLTDYRDDDPSLTPTIVRRRPVLERTKDKVIMDGEIEMLGSRGVGRIEVTLLPPDHWVANVTGGRSKGSVYDYKLTPVAGGTRLDVVYRVRVKRWKSRLKVLLARPFARRDLDRMWGGFAAAMAKDLAAPTRTAPATTTRAAP